MIAKHSAGASTKRAAATRAIANLVKAASLANLWQTMSSHFGAIGRAIMCLD